MAQKDLKGLADCINASQVQSDLHQSFSMLSRNDGYHAFFFLLF